jgi:hypothetical protein
MECKCLLCSGREIPGQGYCVDCVDECIVKDEHKRLVDDYLTAMWSDDPSAERRAESAMIDFKLKVGEANALSLSRHRSYLIYEHKIKCGQCERELQPYQYINAFGKCEACV